MADFEEVIGMLEDALAEVCRLASAGRGGRTAAADAITQIRSGRYDDAVTTLEREFLPKWADKAEAQTAYVLAEKLGV